MNGERMSVNSGYHGKRGSEFGGWEEGKEEYSVFGYERTIAGGNLLTTSPKKGGN